MMNCNKHRIVNLWVEAGFPPDRLITILTTINSPAFFIHRNRRSIQMRDGDSRVGGALLALCSTIEWLSRRTKSRGIPASAIRNAINASN